MVGLQDGGLVPFEIGVAVVGDVTIAVWLGDHNMGDRIHARPSFAYAFHTAFVADGFERVLMRHLDIFDQSVLPATPAAQSSFFMDITFDDVSPSATATCDRPPLYYSLLLPQPQLVCASPQLTSMLCLSHRARSCTCSLSCPK